MILSKEYQVGAYIFFEGGLNIGMLDWSGALQL